MDQLFAALKSGKAIVGPKEFFEDLTADEVNERDENKATALGLAAAFPYPEIVRMLLKYCPGIDVNLPNKHGSTPLMLAASGDHRQVVDLLLACPGIGLDLEDESGNTALHIASADNSLYTVQRLLSSPNININAQNKNGYTAFMRATEAKNGDIMHKLFAQPGVDLNLQDAAGRTALLAAVDRNCTSDNREMVWKLLSFWGVDLNLQDKEGCNPLIVVATHGDEKMANTFLKYPSIDVNLRKKDGNTALMQSARYGNLKVARLLIARADTKVNVQDQDGMTALMWASSRGYASVLKALLASTSIDLNLVDKLGETALDKAKSEKIGDLIRLHVGVVTTDLATSSASQETTVKPVALPATATEVTSCTIVKPTKPSGAAAKTANGAPATPSLAAEPVSWLKERLLMCGMSERWVLDCEQKIVHNEGFSSEKIFAKQPPSRINHAYLTCIGVTGLGTQEHVLQLHGEMHAQYTQSALAVAPIQPEPANLSNSRVEISTFIVPAQSSGPRCLKRARLDGSNIHDAVNLIQEEEAAPIKKRKSKRG